MNKITKQYEALKAELKHAQDMIVTWEAKEFLTRTENSKLKAIIESPANLAVKELMDKLDMAESDKEMAVHGAEVIAQREINKLLTAGRALVEALKIQACVEYSYGHADDACLKCKALKKHAAVFTQQNEGGSDGTVK